jgi:CcmD family protein
MEPWGFVFLAYGIVWGALALYFGSLISRRRKIQAELERLHALGEKKKNGQR